MLIKHHLKPNPITAAWSRRIYIGNHPVHSGTSLAVIWAGHLAEHVGAFNITCFAQVPMKHATVRLLACEDEPIIGTKLARRITHGCFRAESTETASPSFCRPRPRTTSASRCPCFARKAMISSRLGQAISTNTTHQSHSANGAMSNPLRIRNHIAIPYQTPNFI